MGASPSKRISQKRLVRLCEKLFKKFSKNKELKKKKAKQGFSDLTLVFVTSQKMKNLNSTYRHKNYATDILSFAPEDKMQGLGELVMCEGVLVKQAREHKISFKKELDYMIIHGFLHLLGYDHEKSTKEELKMLKLQDKLFLSLSEN